MPRPRMKCTTKPPALGRHNPRSHLAHCPIIGVHFYEPIYWTRTDAIADTTNFGDKRPYRENRPDPTAKRLHTLFKGDVLRLRNNEADVFVTVRGYSATNGKLDLRPAHTSSSVLTWLEETNPSFTKWPEVLPKSPKQNYVSVNVIYQKFRVSKVVITPDGVIHGR